MEVPVAIHHWLERIGLAPTRPVGRRTVVVREPDEVAERLENGTLFAVLLRAFADEDSTVEVPAERLRVEKNEFGVTSPGTILYNWNLLRKPLGSVGVEVDDDTKALICAGDGDVVKHILEQLFKQTCDRFPHATAEDVDQDSLFEEVEPESLRKKGSKKRRESELRTAPGGRGSHLTAGSKSMGDCTPQATSPGNLPSLEGAPVLPLGTSLPQLAPSPSLSPARSSSSLGMSTSVSAGDLSHLQRSRQPSPLADRTAGRPRRQSAPTLQRRRTSYTHRLAPIRTDE